MENEAPYGKPKHKYKVFDTFDFDGIVKIISRLNEVSEKNSPMYEMRMQDGSIKELPEDWIDAGIEHFALDENGRMNDKEYAVSYIASAPEELKVGDRVEVVDAHVDYYQQNGRVVCILMDGGINVDFGKNGHVIYESKQLRKLPDTILFGDSFESAHGKNNPMDRQVGGSHYKDMVIQPVEFCMKNNLDFCTSSAIKYLCRHKNKNGKEDLLKAKHFIDLLIQMEYPDPDFENVV